MFCGYPSNDIIEFIKNHRKLPYDAEIMYLESTGTQWIDTGLFAVKNRKYNIRFLPTTGYAPLYVYNCFPFNATASFTSLGIFGQNNSTGGYRVALNSGTRTVNDDGFYGTWHDGHLDTTDGNRFASLDGAVVYTSTSTGGNLASTHIVLWNNSGKSGSGSGKLAAFSVTDATTGQKIQDLIPVRKNGVGYMYDRVSGQLLGNGGTGDFVLGPDKPYDYEVAYIERDCSVPWVDAGGTEIEGYFDLSRYGIADETLGTMGPLEATWSFEPISVGYAHAIYRLNGLMPRGCMKTPNHTTYSFAAQSGHISEIEGNIDMFHKQRMIYQDGHVKGYIDDILVVDVSLTGTTIVQSPRVLYTAKSTSSTHYNGKARVKNVRIGSDVYLIPVVKGNAVGLYNMVDGELFLEEQECLSAGPRV